MGDYVNMRVCQLETMLNETMLNEEQEYVNTRICQYALGIILSILILFIKIREYVNTANQSQTRVCHVNTQYKYIRLSIRLLDYLSLYHYYT